MLFADVCKAGQHPHAGFVTALQVSRGLQLQFLWRTLLQLQAHTRSVAALQTARKLPARWGSVAAAPTYNPLGARPNRLSGRGNRPLGAPTV